MSAGQLGQLATLLLLAGFLGYCLWQGYREEHSNAPTQNPAARANETTGSEAHPEA